MPREKTEATRLATLGDLIVAAFDATERLTSNPAEAARKATLIVHRYLERHATKHTRHKFAFSRVA